MTNTVFFFLGFFTVTIMFMAFWLLAQFNEDVRTVYNQIFVETLPAQKTDQLT